MDESNIEFSSLKLAYQTQVKPEIPDVYMGLPSGPTEAMFNMRPPTVAGIVKSERERCTISTLVCSTKLTQNGEFTSQLGRLVFHVVCVAALLSLLKWRGQEDRLKEILTSLSTVKGDEIVRVTQLPASVDISLHCCYC